MCTSRATSIYRIYQICMCCALLLQVKHDLESWKKKAVAASEAPVLICIPRDSVTVAGYKQQLIACSSVKEGILSLLSVYYVCSVDYDERKRLFMHFLIFVLAGETAELCKKATQLITNLGL